MLTRKKKVALAVFTSIAALVFAVPYVLPWSSFIPWLESRIGERLHEPVKLRKLHLFLLPLPRLVARDVNIGRTPLLHIDRLTLRPNVVSVFSGTRVIGELRLEGVRVKPGFFKQASSWIKERQAANGGKTAPAASSVQIQRVVVSGAEIAFDRFTLKSLSGEALFANGKPVEIRAAQDTDRLRVVARPAGPQRWSLDVKGQNWTVPGGVPVQLDRLDGSAIVTSAGISAENLRASLYGGAVSGSLAVSWNPGWLVKGDWDIQEVDVRALVALLKRDVAVSGMLTAHPIFTLRAQEPAALLESLALESDFSMRSGAIQKVDLVAAAKNPLSRDRTKGGKTEFEHLSGHLLVDASGYEITGLEVSSGVLNATGDITVARDQKVDGRIDAELRGTASIVSIPLEVAGTVQNPTVFPSKAAVLGAVTGSLLLPGIGTAVGIKVGRFAEKLFRRKKPTRKHAPAPVQ